MFLVVVKNEGSSSFFELELHYCFGDGYKTEYYGWPFERAIDHIYVIGEKKGAVKRFERHSPDYYFPISDHFPAYIDIEI